jgi:hypothetical protein
MSGGSKDVGSMSDGSTARSVWGFKLVSWMGVGSKRSRGRVSTPQQQ